MILRLAVILACLVVLSGDVEMNPGPSQGPSAGGKARGGHAQLSQARLSFDGESMRRTTRQTSVTTDADRHFERGRVRDIQEADRDVNPPQTISMDCDILRGIHEQLSQLNHKIDGMDKKLDREISALQRDNERLNHRVAELEERHDSLEAQSRRNNLIFHGIAESKGGERETWSDCEEKVKLFMEDQLDMTREDTEKIVIERAHRLPGRTQNRAVIAKFLSYKDKDRVLVRAREKLKLDKDHSVREDYTKRVRDIRGKLFPFMKEARDRGELASLSYDKLRINGVLYRFDEDLNDIVPVRRFGMAPAGGLTQRDQQRDTRPSS